MTMRRYLWPRILRICFCWSAPVTQIFAPFGARAMRSASLKRKPSWNWSLTALISSQASSLASARVRPMNGFMDRGASRAPSISQRILPVVLPDRPPASMQILADGSENASCCLACFGSSSFGTWCTRSGETRARSRLARRAPSRAIWRAVSASTRGQTFNSRMRDAACLSSSIAAERPAFSPASNALASWEEITARSALIGRSTASCARS